MDSASHLLRDCIDFEGPSDYAIYPDSPEPYHMDEKSESLQLHDVKAEADGMTLSPLSRFSEVQQGNWEDFIAEEAVDHHRHDEDKTLFIDPMLDPKGPPDASDTKHRLLSDDDSRPPTGSGSSSKSATECTKSASSSTDITMPDEEPPRKRKTRKTRKGSTVGEDGHDRSKFLERNRIAASKCREKRKQYVSNLEDTKKELESQHVHLQMEYNGLLGEIGGLKHHLMAHAKCNDPNIDRWLHNEARRIVQTHTTQDVSGLPFSLGHAAVPIKPTHGRHPSDASGYQSQQGMQLEGLGSDGGRGSIAYSHASSLQTSPTDAASPPFPSQAEREQGLNLDYMPDVLFNSDQPSFSGG